LAILEWGADEGAGFAGLVSLSLRDRGGLANQPPRVDL